MTCAVTTFDHFIDFQSTSPYLKRSIKVFRFIVVLSFLDSIKYVPVAYKNEA